MSQQLRDARRSAPPVAARFKHERDKPSSTQGSRQSSLVFMRVPASDTKSTCRAGAPKKIASYLSFVNFSFPRRPFSNGAAASR